MKTERQIKQMRSRELKNFKKFMDKKEKDKKKKSLFSFAFSFVDRLVYTAKHKARIEILDKILETNKTSVLDNFAE